MITKTVTYTDFNGNKRTETLHFHISKSELLDNLDLKDDFEDIAKSLGTQDEQQSIANVQRILEVIRRLARLGYGVRSEDGSRFRKNPEIWEDFRYSPAYDEFIFGLIGNPEEAVQFLSDLMPADLMEQARASQAQQGLHIDTGKLIVEQPKANLDMSLEELQAEIARRQQGQQS